MFEGNSTPSIQVSLQCGPKKMVSRHFKLSIWKTGPSREKRDEYARFQFHRMNGTDLLCANCLLRRGVIREHGTHKVSSLFPADAPSILGIHDTVNMAISIRDLLTNDVQRVYPAARCSLIRANHRQDAIFLDLLLADVKDVLSSRKSLAKSVKFSISKKPFGIS